MQSKAIFLTLMFLISYISCLRLSNLCYITQKTCKGYYDFIKGYKIQCLKVKCEGDFSIQCGTDYCAKDEEKCQELLKSKIDSKPTGLNESIRACPLVKQEWKISDVCLNGENCRMMQVLAMRYGVWRVARPMKCPCSGNYTYQCETDYCARDKSSCSGFSLKLKSKMEQISLIKNCGNDNLMSYQYS